MAESRAHSLPLGAGRLHVREDGDVRAPCVVLGHSILTDGRMWAPQVACLTGMGLRVLRPDSRGHGLSTSSPERFTLGDLAGDVIAMLDLLDIERAHYVGLSLGGMVGFDLAIHHAARLSSVVICDARADSPPEFAGPWDERIAVANAHGMAALVEPTLARWFGQAFVQAGGDGLRLVREMIAGTSVEGFVGTARALQAFDYRDGLPHLDLPSSWIFGERDGVLPAVMRDLAAQVRQAQVLPVAEAGHLPNLEQTDAFNAALRRHFASVA